MELMIGKMPQLGEVTARSEENGGGLRITPTLDVDENVGNIDLLFENLSQLIMPVVMDRLYPVGKWWVSDDPTPPGEVLGFGEWEPVEDRFLRLGAPGEGGSDTVTLLAENMPQHSHTGPAHTHSMAHTHTGPSHTHSGPSHTHGVGTLATASSGAHTHNVKITYNKTSASGSATVNPSSSGTSTSGYLGTAASAGAHTHTISGATAAAGTGSTGASGTGNTSGSSAASTGSAGTGSTGTAGGSKAFSVVPRYRSAYAWVRTA